MSNKPENTKADADAEPMHNEDDPVPPKRERLTPPESRHYGRPLSPLTPFQTRQIAEIADRADFLRCILECLPKSRELSLALTNLDQAMMWAETAVVGQGANFGRAPSAPAEVSP